MNKEQVKNRILEYYKQVTSMSLDRNALRITLLTRYKWNTLA